jgi:hypothetical protein
MKQFQKKKTSQLNKLFQILASSNPSKLSMGSRAACPRPGFNFAGLVLATAMLCGSPLQAQQTTYRPYGYKYDSTFGPYYNVSRRAAVDMAWRDGARTTTLNGNRTYDQYDRIFTWPSERYQGYPEDWTKFEYWWKPNGGTYALADRWGGSSTEEHHIIAMDAICEDPVSRQYILH